MKNVIKNTLVLVVLFTTSLSFANSPLNVFEDETKTIINVKNVKEGNVLSIKDTDGTILYTENLQYSGSYFKTYDLTALPNGNYFFEIDKGIEINTIQFSVLDSLVVYKEDEATVTYKPFVSSHNNKVCLTKLSLTEEPVRVEIYYENNSSELIYSETIENTLNVERSYSLNKAEKGDYKIVIKTEGKTFVDYVSL